MDTLNKTVLKSMTILKLFLEYEKLNLNQMIELTNLPKTSVYRMVSSLEVIGFLNKDDNGFYKLGLIFLQFGELVSERLDLRKIAFPILEKLRDEVDEAVNLSSKDGTESVYISVMPVMIMPIATTKAISDHFEELFVNLDIIFILLFIPDLLLIIPTARCFQ
jgi:transcriptional regulator, IclR family